MWKRQGNTKFTLVNVPLLLVLFCKTMLHMIFKVAFRIHQPASCIQNIVVCCPYRLFVWVKVTALFFKKKIVFLEQHPCLMWVFFPPCLSSPCLFKFCNCYPSLDPFLWSLEKILTAYLSFVHFENKQIFWSTTAAVRICCEWTSGTSVQSSKHINLAQHLGICPDMLPKKQTV